MAVKQTYVYEDVQYLNNPDNTLQKLNNTRRLSVISSHMYTYDALGNRQTQAETIAGNLLNYTYGYDPLNRLIQVQNGTATQQENYSYDPIGNRLTKQVNATTPNITAYVYDVANQLKEIHQGSAAGTLLASLTYDANGNMKTRSDTGLTLTYDALNRMTQATLGTQTSSYIYDALGRRLQKSVAGVATNYLYTGQNLIAEYGATWGLPTSQYVHGPGIDDVVIRATSTTAQYYHQDGLNSVVALTNAAGTTDASQRFDAWGNKLASTGTAPHYGYTGREPDETGLIFYRARYYDPTAGRFTQRDPIGFDGGINYYSYVNNNPLKYHDPSGLDAVLNWSGNTLNINVRYVYTGPNVTPEIVSRFNNGIETSWSSQNINTTPAPYVISGHDNYNVTTTVTSVISQDPTEIAMLNSQGYSIISIEPRFDPSLVDGYRSNMDPSTGNGVWYAGADWWTAAHEVGHTLNLPDYYSYETGERFPGYDNNIMAQHYGAPDSRNIAEIINRAGGGDYGYDVHVNGQSSSQQNFPESDNVSANGGFVLYK